MLVTKYSVPSLVQEYSQTAPAIGGFTSVFVCIQNSETDSILALDLLNLFSISG